MITILSKIRKIERLKDCDEKDRAKMILVILSLKPACEVLIFKKDALKSLKLGLAPLGLYVARQKFEKKFFKMIEKAVGQRLVLPVGRYAVARDLKTARLLSKTLPDKDHLRFGRLMGYPESAIANFIKGGPFLDSAKAEKLFKKDCLIFNFRMSAKNYQKELKVLKAWTFAIRDNSPYLYKKIVRIFYGR